MPWVAQPRVATWLLVATFVGLLGCPQLLDDDFSMDRGSNADGGAICSYPACGVTYSAGAAGESSPGGSAGSSGAAGVGGTNQGGAAGSGSSGSAGTSASGGTAGSAGSAGSSGGSGGAGDADAGGSAGQAGTAGTAGSGSEPACWTLEMTDTTQDSSSNCVGITGWNDVSFDTGTSLSLSYENGDPCFTGTIASSGWGAVYDLALAPNGSSWNAVTRDVTGFAFSYRGAAQPILKVLYKDPGGTDFCRVVNPGDVTVPFADAHPSCSTSASASTVDTTQMVDIILVFPVGAQSYAVDFCVQISALD